jgi:hypothetical protein
VACPYPDSTPGEPSLRGVLELVPDRVSRDSIEVAVKLRDGHGYVVEVLVPSSRGTRDEIVCANVEGSFFRSQW